MACCPLAAHPLAAHPLAARPAPLSPRVAPARERVGIPRRRPGGSSGWSATASAPTSPRPERQPTCVAESVTENVCACPRVPACLCLRCLLSAMDPCASSDMRRGTFIRSYSCVDTHAFCGGTVTTRYRSLLSAPAQRSRLHVYSNCLSRAHMHQRGGMDSGGMGEGFDRTLVVSNERIIHVGS